MSGTQQARRKEQPQAPSAEDQFCDHCGKPAIFACRSCYKMACTKCAFSSMCRCGHQHLRCDAPSDLTPPETVVENRTDYLIYQHSRHYGEDPQALKKFQEESFQEIYDIVHKGGSTGNAALDRAVRHYGQAEDDVAESFQVPDDQPFSLEDYFKGQDNDFQQKIFRPSIMLTATKESPPAVIRSLKEPDEPDRTQGSWIPC